VEGVLAGMVVGVDSYHIDKSMSARQLSCELRVYIYGVACASVETTQLACLSSSTLLRQGIQICSHCPAIIRDSLSQVSWKPGTDGRRNVVVSVDDNLSTNGRPPHQEGPFSVIDRDDLIPARKAVAGGLSVYDGCTCNG